MSEISETIERLEAILTMAGANFPRDTNIKIETCGTNPNGSITIQYFLLASILEIAKRARSEEQDNA